MAETVVDNTSLIILACPDQWMLDTVVVVHVKDRDIGLGFQIAITLVDNRKIGEARRDRVVVSGQRNRRR